MSLFSRIESDFITAYKAKKDLEVSVLRLLKTALKNRQVELCRPLTDDEILDVVIRQTKQRQESIIQFKAANREELAAKEALELTVLQGYLPTPLSQAEIDAAVSETILSLDAKGIKDMGKVMQALTKTFKGRIDGKALSDLVRSRLSS